MLSWIEHHPGLAAWVQAIGAILALVIAIAVPMLTDRSQAKALRSAAIVSAWDVVDLLEDLWGRIQAAPKDPIYALRSVAAALEGYVSGLQALRTAPLNRPQATIQLSVLETHARIAIDVIRARGEAPLTAKDVAALEEALERARAAFAQLPKLLGVRVKISGETTIADRPAKAG